MNRHKRRRGRALLAWGIIVALLLVGRVAWAETGVTWAALSTSYGLTWWTVDVGGGTVSGGGYRLTGTAGQADAAAPLTGGGYMLYSGFWAGEAFGAGPSYIYLPLLMRN